MRDGLPRRVRSSRAGKDGIPLRRALLLLLGLALLGAFALLVSQRRPLAEAALLAALRDRGVPDPRLRVARLGPGEAELRDVRLGREGEIEIARLVAGWSPQGLAQGHLASLRAEGVRARIDARGGGISLGSLDPALRGGARQEPARAAVALPFAEADLEDVHLVVATPAGPVEAVAQLDWREGAGRLHAELAPATLAPPGGPELRLPKLAVDGDATLAGPELRFAARVSGAAGHLALRVEGRGDLAGGGGSAELELTPLHFAPGALEPGDFAPALAPSLGRATGTLEARGRASWGGDGLRGSLDLGLRDWSVDGPSLRIDHLDAAVRIEGPRPLVVPPHQLVSMARLDFGLELTHGLLSFGVGADGVVDLERAQWELAGGRVHTAGRIDPSAPTQKLLLAIDGVDLGQLLELAAIDGLSGEGRIGGRLPLVRRGDAVEVVDGILTGDSAGGVIRYRPDAAVQSVTAGQVGVDVLLATLSDFRYRALRLTLDGNTGEAVRLGMHLEGSNPNYRGGHPIEFNLNVESQLADLLRDAEVSYRLPKQIEKRLSEMASGQH